MHTENKPLYQTIIDDIQEWILSGNVDYDKPICTEKSLCEKYSVSRITAKHAIKELEHSGVVYRKRGVGSFAIKPQAMDPTQPSSDDVAAHKVYALLIPFHISNGGLLKAAESATNIFSRTNCHFTFHISDRNAHREEILLNKLYSQNINGIVYYPWSSAIPLELLNRFVEKKKPVIILDKPNQHPHISGVVCDNYKGAYMLTEHLVSYGHTNICYLSRYYAEDISSIHDRYEGYKDCLRDNNIITPPRFVRWDTDVQSGYSLLKHIINNLYQEGVTAIECENDEVAFNVHMCCRSLSIQVPEKMSITGFDNINWATTGSAQITTIDQNFALIGKTVAEILLQTSYKPIQSVIPVSLVTRSSTGKV